MVLDLQLSKFLFLILVARTLHRLVGANNTVVAQLPASSIGRKTMLSGYRRILRFFAGNVEGATAVEYVLMVVFIAAVIAATVLSVGVVVDNGLQSFLTEF